MKSNASRHARSVALLCVFMLLAATSSLWAGGKKEKAPEVDLTEKVVLLEDFEAGVGGWGARGRETVEVSDKSALSGTKSLFVSGRKSTWNGPIVDVSEVMLPGESYKISVWVMFQEGPETQSFNLSMQRIVDGIDATYATIGSDRIAKGDWGNIVTNYSVPVSKEPSPLSFYIETPYKNDDAATPNDLLSFYIDRLEITRIPPAAPPMVEKDIPEFHTFFKNLPIGAAINVDDINPRGEKHGLLRHFNVYVHENDMKQAYMQPEEGKFVFDKADALVNYAAKNKKLARGHTLLWHNQYPAWLTRDPADPTKIASKEVLYARLEKHIKTIVSRYKGKIHSWDVVNEVIGEDGALRNSRYLQIAGSEEYIANAFKWAHEADPNALLFINDYSIEFSGAKQDGLYNLVKRLLEQGVPVHGVGLQAHISIGHPTVSDMRTAIRRFAELGVKVQITELDMSVYASGNEAKKEATREVLLDQAGKYRALFQMFQEEADAGNLQMVVLWGLADMGTWLDNFPVAGRTNYPLLFGKDLRAKPAYWAIVDPSKLPIGIKQGEVISTKELIKTPDDTKWDFVTARTIEDRAGKVYGTYKLVWTDTTIQALVNVFDKTKDASDEITIFIEPKNLKEAKVGPNVKVIKVPRSKAVADTGETWTALVDIPFAGRVASKIGFDLRVTDGKNFYSWNDLDHTQDKVTENYGTVTFKILPPVTYAKRGTPRIDGQIEKLWDTAEKVPLNVKTQGYTLDGSTFRALWDDEYLYVLFEVQDALLNDNARDPWEQDSIEVFIDQNNGKTKTYEEDDAQYRVSFRNKASFNGGSEELFRSRSRIFPGGYVVEVAVPFTHLKPAAKALIGFDAQVNEADASGTRSGIRNWVSDNNMGYQDMSVLGVMMLID